MEASEKKELIDFLKFDSGYYGEKVDHIEQIGLRAFNGKDLFDYVRAYHKGQLKKGEPNNHKQQ